DPNQKTPKESEPNHSNSMILNTTNRNILDQEDILLKHLNSLVNSFQTRNREKDLEEDNSRMETNLVSIVQ
ncbi:22028_t:CDS:1, partial [Gigaspora margarita]